VSYSLTTIWHERQRFVPAVLAVAFSALLVVVQSGLMLGLLSMMSLPVDKSTGDVWVGYPGTRSVDLGRPIPERWLVRLSANPEILQAEPVVIGFSLWTLYTHGSSETKSEVVTIVGTRMHTDSVGAVEALRTNPELLSRLSEPQTVAVDETEVGRLGIRGADEYAEILGIRVRVVGLVKGYKSLGGPYVFCGVDTAKLLLKYQPDEVTYLVGKCPTASAAEAVAKRMGGYPQLSAFTAADLSAKSRLHWLITTKAGIAIGFTALLGLLVGGVVTSQTLYSATAASQREFATLRAMGIPRWRLQLSVISQSFWVGLFGILVALPFTLILSETATRLGTNVRLHPIIVVTAIVVVMTMAVGSGLAALRSFQNVDPAHNIR
jgi:putative ABC transport system permease protein